MHNQRVVTSSQPLVTTRLAQKNWRRKAGKYWRRDRGGRGRRCMLAVCLRPLCGTRDWRIKRPDTANEIQHGPVKSNDILARWFFGVRNPRSWACIWRRGRAPSDEHAQACWCGPLGMFHRSICCPRHARRLTPVSIAGTLRTLRLGYRTTDGRT